MNDLTVRDDGVMSNIGNHMVSATRQSTRSCLFCPLQSSGLKNNWDGNYPIQF
jgi:hypothetical protein